MDSRYKPLALQALQSGVGYCRPEPAELKRVSLDSPAIEGMTDLCTVTLLTVKMSTPITSARARMIEGRVRLLLVTDADGVVLGVISVRDIDSDRVQKIMSKSGLGPDEINVADVMTLKGRIQVLALAEVEHACIGDIIATMREAGRQHALVLGVNLKTDEDAVRGIFSLSHLARQLGLQIHPSTSSTTYEDIESELQALLD